MHFACRYYGFRARKLQSCALFLHTLYIYLESEGSSKIWVPGEVQKDAKTSKNFYSEQIYLDIKHLRSYFYEQPQ